MPGSGSCVLVIAGETMGQGDPELGRRLLGNFLHALEAGRRFPDTICFYNEGVRLVVQGSPALQNLQTLEALGVRLLACRTCIEFYGLGDRVAVGTVGTMADIVAALFDAGSVIRL
ncbi:MAG: sulfurtransferase-like selenium metabolism protein YedF [Armatimonadetes bacterium]|nr:sulfurtransferase-like selenium metabolism protein YedF [Armatimonadota bacterium]